MINRQRSAIAGLAILASSLVGVVVHEGWSDTPIIPVPGDVLTIGPGRTTNVKPGEKTTVQRELILLLADMEGRKSAIAKCVHVPLYQHELSAYMNLAYNIGTSAFCRKADKSRKNPDGTPNPEPDRLNDVLNKGQYDEACRRILGFDKFKGKPLRGLTLRRQAEYRQCKGESP